MKSETDRSPAGFGHWHCAILSLVSGMVGVAVSFYLWWELEPDHIRRLGQRVGLLSAIMGLMLAGLGALAPRKRVRWLAITAIIFNIAILSFTLDTMFGLIRW